MNERHRSRTLTPVAALLLAGTLWAASAPANLDPHSTLVATFKQSGVPVDAEFKTFSGRIVYDPANPAAASATLEVTAASLDIGDEDYNAEVRRPAWLNTAMFPKATFVSAAIAPTGAGRFNATGTLTMKGRMQTITIPITVKAAGGGQAFDGAFSLSRKAWAIGDPTWESVLEDVVVVKFHLVSSGK